MGAAVRSILILVSMSAAAPALAQDEWQPPPVPPEPLPADFTALPAPAAPPPAAATAAPEGPPIPEPSPRAVWMRLSGGRRVEGRLLCRDDEYHWVDTEEGTIRVRIDDVESMTFVAPTAEETTPPSETPAHLPKRWDPRTFLTVTGAIVFGLTYLGSVGAIGEGSDDMHFAIPLVGPFAYSMAQNEDGELAGLHTFATFLQAGGLAMLVCGLVCSEPAPYVRAPE